MRRSATRRRRPARGCGLRQPADSDLSRLRHRVRATRLHRDNPVIAWEYLAVTYVWTSEDSDESIAPNRWKYDISARWRTTYGATLERCQTEQTLEDLWEQLGADGWEAFSHDEMKRNQYAQTVKRRDGEGTYVQVFATVVAARWSFKRPREG